MNKKPILLVSSALVGKHFTSICEWRNNRCLAAQYSLQPNRKPCSHFHPPMWKLHGFTPLMSAISRSFTSDAGGHNRLGFAVQLCYLRYPGYALPADKTPPAGLLSHVASQLRIDPLAWAEYARRDETRREHALELQTAFGYRPFTAGKYRKRRSTLTELALQTNKGCVIAQQLIAILRKYYIILPPIHLRLSRLLSPGILSHKVSLTRASWRSRSHLIIFILSMKVIARCGAIHHVCWKHSRSRPCLSQKKCRTACCTTIGTVHRGTPYRYQRLYRSHICIVPAAGLPLRSTDTRPQRQEFICAGPSQKLPGDDAFFK